MILSRAKPASSEGAKKTGSGKKIPKLEEFLEKRDYTGALTLLEFNNSSNSTLESELWMGYCAFHLGDYKRAATIYENLRNKEQTPADLPTNLACCYFYLGMYPESQKMLEDAPDGKLKNRLLFHLAHKMGSESKLMEHHHMLQDVIEDQLSLASIHYLRAHYQEAIDVYKKILLENSIYHQTIKNSNHPHEEPNTILKNNQFTRVNNGNRCSTYLSDTVFFTNFNKEKHPEYSLDIAPFDYYLLRSMKYALSDLHHQSVDETQKLLDDFITSRDTAFFSKWSSSNCLKNGLKWDSDTDDSSISIDGHITDRKSDVHLIKELKDSREYFALNVYVALCYYKLDYYDVAQEVLQVYLQKYPDSAIAINLKACNHFRLYNGTAAQNEMKQLLDNMSSSFSFSNDLIRHNTVVFKGGEGALQILPNLVDVIPEARLNLVIYYLKQDDVREAFELIKDLEPTVPQEYILKGIVNAVMGQETNSRDNMKTAQQYFQLVGSSASECDTIPGRQCMASCFFLYRQFEEVLVYLNSIKTYFSNEDNFNFNYGQAQSAAGYFKEAEEAFLTIRNEKYKNDYVYISLLAHCYIMNKKPQLAWELFLKMETSTESFNLLQLIANDCYKVGEFWYAAKAFDVLERMDPSPENWEGKRGACCGTFQYIVAERQPKELLPEVIQLLKNTSNSQVEQIIRVMRKWGKENRINC